jgi:hypothetical protein
LIRWEKYPSRIVDEKDSEQIKRKSWIKEDSVRQTRRKVD